MLRVLLKRQSTPLKLNCIIVRTLNVRRTAKSSSGVNGTNINSNVAGLSKNCVDIPDKPVGPNAAKDKEYKNPEYFCYNINSFAEAEVEMEKYRLPAPSNKNK